MAIANLIVKIGADIAELKSGADKALSVMEKTGSRIDTIGKSIKSTLLASFSIGAVTRFGQELVRMSDDIVRTADRTGLLTDEVQKLSFIADQSGNSLEEITAAIGQMQNRLSSGDKGAVGAVKALGLSFQDLIRLDPFEQMSAIADAIGKIPDPAKRAELAMDLFGRSGIALLPTLTAKFKDLGDEAPIMSEKTVRALDSAGDAYAKFALSIKVFVANAFSFVSEAMDKGIARIYRYIASLSDAVADIYRALLKVPGSTKLFPTLEADLKGLTTQAQWFRDAAMLLENPVKRATTSIQSLGTQVTAVEPAVKKSTAAVREKAVVARQAEVAIKDLGVAVEQGLIPSVRKLGTEVAVDVTGLTALGDAIERVRELGEHGIIPQGPARLGIDIGIPEIPVFVEAGKKSGQAFGESFGAQMASTIIGAFQGGGSPVSAIGALIGSEIGKSVAGKLSASLLKEGSGIFSKALGGVLNSALPVIGSLIGPLASKLWNSLFGTAGRDAVKEFASSFGGFDALHVKLNELGAEGERLWIKLTQGVGRNNPQQAQAAINEITAALDKQKEKQAEVGMAAESSAQKQTDAFDKARAAIATLDGQIKSLSDSIAGEAPEEFMGIVEQQTRARIAAITEERDKAASALDETMKLAAEGAQAASDAIRETLAANDFVARIRFEVDELPDFGGGGGKVPGYATGTRGQYVDFGAGTLAVLHGRERIVTEGEALGVGGGGTVTLSAPDALRLLHGEIVTVARQDAARGGTRSRSGHGRTY